MKVLSILLGLLLIAGGALSIFAPGTMMISIGSLIGIFMLAHGVGMLITHFRFRAWGEGWALAGAVLSAFLGIVLMTNTYFRVLTDTMLMLLAGVWIMAVGIVLIVLSIRLARIRSLAPWERRGNPWAFLLVVGIALFTLGILAYVHPVVSAITVNTLLGIYVVAAGINLVAVACCRPDYF